MTNAVKAFAILQLCCFVSFLLGCGKSEGPTNNATAQKKVEANASAVEEKLVPTEEVSAEEVVERQLEKMGLQRGLNRNGNIVEIGASYAEVRKFEKWGIERHEMRNIIAREAYFDAILKIAEDVKMETDTGARDADSSMKIVKSVDEKNGPLTFTSSITSSAKADLTGAFTIMEVETLLGEHGEYRVAVAVIYVPGLVNQFTDGKSKKRGKKSIVEWIDDQDVLAMLGTRFYRDDEGRGWLVAWYPVSAEKALGHEKEWRRKAEELAAFALGGKVECESKEWSQTIQEGASSKSTGKSDAVEDEEFEDCYFGADGILSLRENWDEGSSRTEMRVNVTAAYAGERATSSLERDVVFPIDGSKIKVFIAAFPIPNKTIVNVP